MANNIQLVIYEGFLAEKPDMRYTPAGKGVTNFRIGSNYQYKDSSGEIQKEVTWLKITAWGKLGEIVSQYCDKGSHVIVTGRLRVGANGSPSVYPLKNGQGYAASYEVTAREVRILKGKEGSNIEEEVVATEEEDIPF